MATNIGVKKELVETEEGNLHEVLMHRISSIEELISLIKNPDSKQLPIQFVYGNRESLLKVSNDSITYYDLDGRPMMVNMKEALQEAFPHMPIEDECRRERLAAAYTTGIFHAEQTIQDARNINVRRGMALDKVDPILAHTLALNSAPTHAALSATGFFLRGLRHQT